MKSVIFSAGPGGWCITQGYEELGNPYVMHYPFQVRPKVYTTDGICFAQSVPSSYIIQALFSLPIFSVCDKQHMFL